MVGCVTEDHKTLTNKSITRLYGCYNVTTRCKARPTHLTWAQIVTGYTFQEKGILTKDTFMTVKNGV